MATANIRAVITAEDNASKVVSTFGQNVSKSNDQIITGNQKSAVSFNQVLVATAGLAVTTKGLVGIIDDSVSAANKQQAALVGLSSIAKAFGQNQDEATEAAKRLTKDGLLTIADAAKGLKNLLQSGFSLPQAIKLMERFKDSAAFGKQSALSFGDAVSSATEGIKNGNSVLVDNAGVTKNLSIILKEAGFAEQDLMRASTDASVRQALFNGILKETKPQIGDAARLTELYAGKQAMLSQKSFELKAQIGQALQPALVKLLETVTPLIEKFANFATQHPQVVAAVLIITTVGIGLLAVLGSIGLAITGLTPLIGALGGNFSLATGGVAAFSGALGISTLMLGGVVAAAGFAIFEILKLKSAFDEANKSIDNTNRSLDSTENALKQAKVQYDSGKISKERYNAILKGAYGRATGGPVQANTPYIWNEQGKEMFMSPTGGTIIPANKLGSTGGSPINISVNAGAFMGTEMEARKFAEKILEHLKDVASSRSTTVSQMMGS